MPNVYDIGVETFGLKLTKTSDATVKISFDGETCFDISDEDEVKIVRK